MRILIVEDDPSIHRIISRRLREEGYAVDDCYDGEEGLDYILSAAYDCVILDWMLPRKDGIALLKEMRSGGNSVPVLMLTAKDTVSNRVDGLDAGADDYLTKPFAYDELSARVRALLRRNMKEKQTVLQAAFALLEYLMRNQGTVLIRSQIADHVWDYGFDYDSNVVDVYIRYLRNKLEKGFSSRLIHTVRGYGYVLREEEEKDEEGGGEN